MHGKSDLFLHVFRSGAIKIRFLFLYGQKGTNSLHEMPEGAGRTGGGGGGGGGGRGRRRKTRAAWQQRRGVGTQPSSSLPSFFTLPLCSLPLFYLGSGWLAGGRAGRAREWKALKSAMGPWKKREGGSVGVGRGRGGGGLGGKRKGRAEAVAVSVVASLCWAPR